MGIGTLLLILQIIGALPGVIEFARMLWEKLRQIRDRNQRKVLQKQFRAALFKRTKLSKMSVGESLALRDELTAIHKAAKEQILMERASA